jgi:flagellar motor switch protein FliM
MAFEFLKRKREKGQSDGAQQMNDQMAKESHERFTKKMQEDSRNRAAKFHNESMKTAQKAHQDFAKRNRKF